MNCKTEQFLRCVFKNFYISKSISFSDVFIRVFVLLHRGQSRSYLPYLKHRRNWALEKKRVTVIFGAELVQDNSKKVRSIK